MNPVCVASQLERVEQAENTNTVGAAKHLQFQLYLEKSQHLCNSTCQVFVVVLEPIKQAIPTVFHGFQILCVHQHNEDYRLI